MKTIVCNTLSGAVSEYTRYAFQSITPTHAGSATGLYVLAGDKDVDLSIVATVRLPATLRETTLKKHIAMVYLSMRGAGCAQFGVSGQQAMEWRYSFPLRHSGQTRCEVGKGIRENYLGFSVSTPAGQDFTLDRIEILHVQSKTRRV